MLPSLRLCLCGGQNSGVPRDVHVLIPRFVNVLCYVTKQLTLRWEDDPGLSGWVGYNHKGTYKTERQRARVMPCEKDLTGVKGRGHKPWNVAASRSWKRQENRWFLAVSRKEHGPANTTIEVRLI